MIKTKQNDDNGCFVSGEVGVNAVGDIGVLGVARSSSEVLSETSLVSLISYYTLYIERETPGLVHNKSLGMVLHMLF